MTYTRHDCEGGILRVHLRGDPSLFTEPQTVSARIGGEDAGRVTFQPNEEKQLMVALQPPPCMPDAYVLLGSPDVSTPLT